MQCLVTCEGSPLVSTRQRLKNTDGLMLIVNLIFLCLRLCPLLLLVKCQDSLIRKDLLPMFEFSYSSESNFESIFIKLQIKYRFTGKIKYMNYSFFLRATVIVT
jgi:hypothetical protein